MSRFFRPALRSLLRFLGRYPALKRFLVNVIYRFPTLDGKLRTVAHRVIHPEAVLDVDARRLPESSRRAYDRMRGDTRR
ncbi:hypothetical protein BJI69_11435 [Luteibacter rhizovicinus DSM 16549]|uniref:Uncharacterized protein n=1 Tax=Luteibacter rhizovicinus DSM 16549 TaxID=1440763 RepID=A0A0G9H9Y2_9GAMM|nr:hypothetical protein [Luteibacter rhizovicinus]APG04451.1 hypothetical protein BJI69_11435 [Luteibacter rhizovicinus DSM 16549]KLD66251.1 hypothetical protein Y883_14655 [Luteibacter rhizovicinus DSM 16549]